MPVSQQEQTKICNQCQQEKRLSEFHQMKVSKDGRRPTCIVCRNAARRASYSENPEPVRIAVREWKESLGASERAEITRRHRLKKRYGLTVDGLPAKRQPSLMLD